MWPTAKVILDLTFFKFDVFSNQSMPWCFKSNLFKPTCHFPSTSHLNWIREFSASSWILVDYIFYRGKKETKFTNSDVLPVKIGHFIMWLTGNYTLTFNFCHFSLLLRWLELRCLLSLFCTLDVFWCIVSKTVNVLLQLTQNETKYFLNVIM